MDARGVRSVRAIATSAIREAENQDEFLRKVRVELGITIEVVSGVEEGRLIYLGVLQACRSMRSVRWLSISVEVRQNMLLASVPFHDILQVLNLERSALHEDSALRKAPPTGDRRGTEVYHWRAFADG